MKGVTVKGVRMVLEENDEVQVSVDGGLVICKIESLSHNTFLDTDGNKWFYNDIHVDVEEDISEKNVEEFEDLFDKEEEKPVNKTKKSNVKYKGLEFLVEMCEEEFKHKDSEALLNSIAKMAIRLQTSDGSHKVKQLQILAKDVIEYIGRQNV